MSDVIIKRTARAEVSLVINGEMPPPPKIDSPPPKTVDMPPFCGCCKRTTKIKRAAIKKWIINIKVNIRIYNTKIFSFVKGHP